MDTLPGIERLAYRFWMERVGTHEDFLRDTTLIPETIKLLTEEIWPLVDALGKLHSEFIEAIGMLESFAPDTFEWKLLGHEVEALLEKWKGVEPAREEA